MRGRSRFLAPLAALTLVVALPAAATADPGDERQVLELVNAARGERSLPSLELEEQLIDDARGHTAAMIAAGDIFHSRAGELAAYAVGWDLLGENVGLGPDPRVVHDAFMRSDTHRNNILGDFDSAAVGADRSADGTLFVTLIFMKRSPQGLDGPVAESDSTPAVVHSAMGFPRSAIARAFGILQARQESAEPREVCGSLGAPGLACID